MTRIRALLLAVLVGMFLITLAVAPGTASAQFDPFFLRIEKHAVLLDEIGNRVELTLEYRCEASFAISEIKVQLNQGGPFIGKNGSAMLDANCDQTVHKASAIVNPGGFSVGFAAASAQLFNEGVQELATSDEVKIKFG